VKKGANVVACAATLAAVLGVSAQAQEELIYVAVEPCRIADTRQSAVGVVRADTFRNFLVAGDASELAAQGGTRDCENPKGDTRPVAVAAYIVAIPAASSVGRGVLTAYPSDLPPPPTGTGSTVNFDKDQVIGNTTIVTVCSSERDCPDDGELAVLARKTDEHVVIDVQGYFYPSTIPGYQVVQAPFAVANRDQLVAEARCPAGKKVQGGGGNLVRSTWVMEGSYPVPDGSAWRVSYKSTGATFNASGSVWAICADAG
jgi:hypothetical protein